MKKLNLLCECLLVVWAAAQTGQALVEDALVTEQVYLDLEVEGNPAERVIIGLFGATSPKTVRNFVALANHEVSYSSWQKGCVHGVCAEKKFQTTFKIHCTHFSERLWLPRLHISPNHSQLHDAR